MEIGYVHRYRVDMNMPVMRQMVDGVLVRGDALAHQLRVTVYKGSEQATLTGWTATVYAVRSDGYTVPNTATITEGEVVADLEAACSDAVGRMTLLVRISYDNAVVTLLVLDAHVVGGATDAYVDVSDLIPSLDELLAQVARIEGAVDAAEDATTAASEAATHAADAADAIEGLTASASTLPTGADATATVTLVDGVHHITLGLPRGAKGDQGVPGMGNVSTVCGVQPSDAGDVPLTAEDVGAAPAAHATATNNPHSVTAAQVGAPTVAALDAVANALTTHAGAADNPHGVTAALAGAVALPVLLLDGVSWLASGASPITVPGLSEFAYVILDAGAYGTRKFAVSSSILPTFFACTTAGNMYIYDSRVAISGNVMTLSVSKRILLSADSGSVTMADNPTSITISIWGCNA